MKFIKLLYQPSYFLILLMSVFSTNTIFSYEMSIDQEVAKYAPEYLVILKKIYSDLNIPMNYNITPASRSIHDFNISKVDALDARIASITLIFPKAVLIQPPLMKEFTYGVWKNKNASVTPFDKAKFTGTRGTLFVEVYKKKFNIPESRFTYSRDAINAFQLVNAGRADYVIGNSFIPKDRDFAKDFEFVPEYAITDSIHHIISKELLPYKDQIEKKFKEYEEQGVFNVKKIIK